MDILRQELIETQKTRSELIKWKLLLVSALGATGLGFAKTKSDLNAEVLLCCIPFVCAYVDAQYVNLSLRIMGIATFFREVAPQVGVSRALTEYENLMNFARGKIRVTYPRVGCHGFQSWLVRASSVLFSGFVALYAGASFVLRRPRPNVWLMLAMFLTGIGGVAFDLWLFHHSHGRREIIEKAGAKFRTKLDFCHFWGVDDG